MMKLTLNGIAVLLSWLKLGASFEAQTQTQRTGQSHCLTGSSCGFTNKFAIDCCWCTTERKEGWWTIFGLFLAFCDLNELINKNRGNCVYFICFLTIYIAGVCWFIVRDDLLCLHSNPHTLKIRSSNRVQSTVQWTYIQLSFNKIPRFEFY